MKHALSSTLKMILAAMFVLAVAPVAALTTASGPYYATPSWDQQLPASTRFIVLSNWGGAAVLDRESGLVWEQSPSTSKFTWDNNDAALHCNNLNVGGRKGWKLPSIQELASLVDPTQSLPVLPAGHPFTNVQSSFYWSATTSSIGSAFAWGVFFDNGVVSGDGKSFAWYVWCVRGGPGGDVQ